MQPYIGEIRLFSFGRVPKGWALCNGALLPIAQNQALFSKIGITYGGDGRVTFGLPNLKERVPIHRSPNLGLGTAAGAPTITVLQAQLPRHNHSFGIQPSNAQGLASPTGAYPTVSSADNLYDATPTAILNPAEVPIDGGTQPHNNMQPSLALEFCIALQGIYYSEQ